MSMVPTVLASIDRFPPNSTPRTGGPGTRTALVSSFSQVYDLSGPSDSNAARRDAADDAGSRSSNQAAPGPCTVGSRALRHRASCSAVTSENPTMCFAGPSRTRSTIRCRP